jgi:hypothetical protein
MCSGWQYAFHGANSEDCDGNSGTCAAYDCAGFDEYVANCDWFSPYIGNDCSPSDNGGHCIDDRPGGSAYCTESSPRDETCMCWAGS